MATFQLSNKNKKNKSEKNIKAIIGWVLLGISTFVFLFSATKLLPFLNYFFLGILGVFVYPVSVLGSSFYFIHSRYLECITDRM